jgi:ectoine hydroxylase
LGSEQCAEYARRGILAVEGVFSGREIAALRAAFEEDCAVDGPHRVLEDDGRSVRALYASHLRHATFDWLVRSDRLLGPARQLTGPDLYVWQFKINTKRPFGGAAWCWHQDYIVWREFDGLPTPETLSVAIFLDEVSEFNGPMVFVPSSHVEGVIEPPCKEGVASSRHVDPLDFELPNQTVAELVSDRGIVAPKGAAGTVVFFHANVVHASGLNISPFRRDLLIATYNPLRNAPRGDREARAEYLIGSPRAALELADSPIPA